MNNNRFTSEKQYLLVACDLSKRQTHFAAEQYLLQLRAAVKPAARIRTHVRIQPTDLVVVMQRAHTDPRERSEFADGEFFHNATNVGYHVA